MPKVTLKSITINRPVWLPSFILRWITLFVVNHTTDLDVELGDTKETE